MFAPGRKFTLFLSGLVLMLFFSLRSFPRNNAEPLPAAESEEDQQRDGHEKVVAALPLPPEYTVSSQYLGTQSQFCLDRFSTKFLEDFRDRRADYCSEGSTSNLTCFHTVNSGSFASGSIDSFCIAETGTFFDVERLKFAFDCQIRDLSDQEFVPSFWDLQSYQYLTGAKFLLSEYMNLNLKSTHKSLSQTSAKPPKGNDQGFIILLKRETNGNLWHCLNEIMAILSTLDVLRIASDPGFGEKAIFSPRDITMTEIVILDDFPDGPYFDLFRLASGRDPVRLDEWITSRTDSKHEEDAAGLIPTGKIIIPFAGAANPLWSDWVSIDCEDNTMLRVFVKRIFDFYGIPRTREREAAPRSSTAGFLSLPSPPRLNVSIVVRKNSRELIGIDGFLFEAAKARFSPVANLRLVGFEGKPFQEQIEIARNTDVLVGMHGAGLTHVMFMEEGRGAVVEIQPDRLCHKGFRNLAKMTRQLYFVAGANRILGNCYSGPEGDMEQMPDDGTAFLPYDTSRCWSFTTDPEDWSFVCSDPKVTGGEKSYMICKNRVASDDWYQTCTKKEASEIWWMTRYIMEQDKFLKLVGDAIQAVQERETNRKGQTATADRP